MNKKDENLPADAPAIIKQIKWLQLHWREHWKLILISIIIVVSAPISTYLISLYKDNSNSMADTNSDQIPSPIITPLDRKKLLASVLLQEYREWIDSDSGKYSHILIAELSINYGDSDFNIPSYLRKVCCPKIKDIGRVIGSKRFFLQSIDTNWNTYAIKIDGKSNSGDKLKIAVNDQVTVDVAMDKIEWESMNSLVRQNDVPNISFYAASIKLTVGDPNFPLIRMARLIPTKDTTAYLLDFVVENHSKVDLPITGFVFTSKKREFASCFEGSRWQPVYLNWSKTNSSSVDAYNASASTILEGEKVDVRAKFRDACSDGYNTLQVNIPSVRTIRANESERFGFKFVENGPGYVSVKDLPTREISLVGESSLIDTLLIEDAANKIINGTQ